ncbi:4-hydroxy-tetrahydrodipicolinate reductase [Gloeobacter violaceus]|uniref:4-hydroxy-tetrahydrodipicolinate reductase n=1 Tax=Gloeobacter violaceus (strain ATCC 29082 / PCC 7421) TaxID=251221 RepID=DAPB_GLOVI|nr:4-hydroxy-tetrahydrodipicolinate reductase [Gloeobacter violaceus]Q7NLC0.1 RecName: Full=4-hydroxy-tetrahydrodipicolinate reductase; Short=HTPA reductase [Gloeobacter violaceus PCC 7421]BAC89147.1 dihydrodipicolinate reductase [Gloeobacter violaceus PCC 7421]
MAIPVVVVGCAGKMGREVVKAVHAAPDMAVVGAVDRSHIDEDAGELAGIGPIDVLVTDNLEITCAMVAQERAPGVMVDFTHPRGIYDRVRSAIAYGVRPVVGTTGLPPEHIEELAEFADKASTGCIVAPNFAIGMILLQQACLRAAEYFDHVEIIELHHNRKADAPSGTALATAQMIATTGKTFNVPEVSESELVAGARGGMTPGDIRIHSLRLPGLLAHQAVIFGGLGQSYTLRHDTTDRAAYMPGVLLAIRKVLGLKSLVYGLEKII